MSWNEVLKNLNIPVNAEYNDYSNFTDDELLKILKTEIEKTGIVKRDYNKFRKEDSPSSSVYLHHFKKTWNEVLGLIGIRGNNYRVSEEELLVDMYRVFIEQKDLSISIYDKFGKFSSHVAKEKFGSWNKSKLKLKMYIRTKVTVKESNEELLKMYIDFSKKLGKTRIGASSKDLDKNDNIYNSDVFVIRFGGMPELKKMAGFEPLIVKKKRSKEQIKEILISYYKENNKRLTNNEIKKRKEVSQSTILRYFKTTKMSDVWEEIEEVMKNSGQE